MLLQPRLATFHSIPVPIPIITPTPSTILTTTTILPEILSFFLDFSLLLFTFLSRQPDQLGLHFTTYYPLRSCIHPLRPASDPLASSA
ncbi:hypothetical protein FJTKL_15316 [Diaporthe vaccinii]|uniref:Uncharacterized protein n=1 Tax=Diaporthe vaccinii TaxID=105482 RepID=A0ABR4E588_9PEZI